jgi:hypothetical protein
MNAISNTLFSLLYFYYGAEHRRTNFPFSLAVAGTGV